MQRRRTPQQYLYSIWSVTYTIINITKNVIFFLQPIFVPLSRIHKYVSQDQLPTDLGGSWIYNHEQWIHNRVVNIYYRKCIKVAIINTVWVTCCRKLNFRKIKFSKIIFWNTKVIIWSQQNNIFDKKKYILIIFKVFQILLLFF